MADLTGADLGGADLTGGNLSGAHLSGADLTVTVGLDTVDMMYVHYDATTKWPVGFKPVLSRHHRGNLDDELVEQKPHHPKKAVPNNVDARCGVRCRSTAV
jgi:hypothetical protein